MNTEYSEIYLSAVIGRSVINSRGEELGLLRDLIMVPGEVFPEVSHIVIKGRKGKMLLPWSEVSLFTHVVISSAGIAPGLRPYEYREAEILVRRDLLDKQIVDVDGAKVVRVNDIKLGKLHDKLCIFSVDIGFRGLLRRLGYERFGENVARLIKKDIPNAEISWEYVQPLEPHSSKLALNIARNQMNEIHPADLADIIEQIPIQSIKTVLESIDPETTGDTLYELEPEMRSVVISQMDAEHASDILEEMSPDDAADVLSDLSEETAQQLLGMMDDEEKEEIEELLEHEEDTAGGFMTSEFLTLPLNHTVGAAIAEVRRLAGEIENVSYAYLLDDAEHLEGVLSLQDLLASKDDELVVDVMEDNIRSVNVGDAPEEILETLTRYDLTAVAVLDEEQRMVGIVTVDDVLAHYLPRLVKKRG
ncbi:magnesium transporter [Geobacter sp. FeAm09]|uniref:magnesium transporter MgtE N-terminal domain-containing protein n=1 Tax=Geobacter sp. FeAm09 TaxID=2597769 RepID=UPI0011EFB493|nr:CBS domain-containing protein [Geobacter sp. FeAm09]QEM68566.1 magnesium transporter [Geobacter sp. FeAm09]